MKKLFGSILVLAVLLATSMAVAQDDDSKKEANKDEKRAEINKVADEAIEEVVQGSEKAKALFAKAKGWAVFDNLRVTFIVSGGGGTSVAVSKRLRDE